MTLLRRLEGPQTLGRGPAFWTVFAVAVAAAVAYPWFADGYTVGNTAYFFCWVFMALGLCLIWGYGGALSFGQTAFFGLSGYAYDASDPLQPPIVEIRVDGEPVETLRPDRWREARRGDDVPTARIGFEAVLPPELADQLTGLRCRLQAITD